MSIKQKVSDATLLLKTERRYQIMVGLGIAAILFLVLHDPGPKRAAPNKRQVLREEQQRKSLTTANEEAYKDIVMAFKEQQDKLTKAIEQNTESDKARDTKLEEYNNRTAEIFKKILERLADAEASSAQASQQGGVGQSADAGIPEPVDVGANMPADGATSLAATQDTNTLEQFGEIKAPEAPPPPPQGPGKVAFIGAGDSVQVKLLAAVNAPTDGTPYPVLFKLTGDIQGPDGSTLPLGEARLIAAAQGSLTDSRVLFRITKLNIRLPDGRRKVVDVDGWVVGEDGIRGMQGVPIDPIGKAIGAAGLAGGLSAIGDGISKSTTKVTQDYFGQTSEVITGDLGTYAAGKGVSGAAGAYAGLIQERVKELIPHIQVYSGREGTAVFAQSVAIRGLFEQLEDEQDVFNSAD